MQAKAAQFDWYAQMIAYLLGSHRLVHPITSAVLALFDRPDMQWPMCAWTDADEQPHVMAVEWERRVIHARLVGGRPTATAYRLSDVRSVTAVELCEPETSDTDQWTVASWRVEFATGEVVEPRVLWTGEHETVMRSVMLSLLRSPTVPPPGPVANNPGLVGYVGVTFDGD